LSSSHWKFNTYTGAELGKSNYVRQRELEFSLKNVPKHKLISKIKETKILIDKILSQLDPKDLEKDYPVVIFKEKMTIAFFLIHLVTHLTYHLGQINYHRRLLVKI